MFKDFVKWIKYKMFINANRQAKIFKEREVWWCSLGVNVGKEIDGKNEFFNRPVLIVKKFNHYQFWGIPLTSRIKQQNELYFEIKVKGRINYVCLSQMRVLDSKRLNNTISEVDNFIFQQIITKKKIYFQNNHPLSGDRWQTPITNILYKIVMFVK